MPRRESTSAKLINSSRSVSGLALVHDYFQKNPKFSALVLSRDKANTEEFDMPEPKV